MVNRDGQAVDICRKGDLDLQLMADQRRAQRVAAWAKRQDDLDRGMDPKTATWLYGIEPDVNRETFISTDTGFSTFALLHYGVWYEKGHMGWWAMVSNENPQWSQVFDDIFTSTPDDHWLTVVDCHI